MLKLFRAMCGLALLSSGVNPAAAADPTAQQAGGGEGHGWQSLITVEQLQKLLAEPNLLVIDARSAKEYDAGHIPGAISLPGSEWRTPATKVPSKEGVGQKIFRTESGAIDVARYEKLLSDAGVKPEHRIVVYGNHAGKADGSVAATILLKLGHADVKFVDGIGFNDWQKAGYEVSTAPTKLAATKYEAHADAKKLWSYQDVIENLENKDVVFLDSRTPEEYAGTDLRGNTRGGHLPGAKLLNGEEFLNKDKTTIDYQAAKAKIEALVPKDKTVVIYCQSGTRCSHKELLLKDLGYKNVVLYDASWQEWGNRKDTPIEGEKKAPAASVIKPDAPAKGLK